MVQRDAAPPAPAPAPPPNWPTNVPSSSFSVQRDGPDSSAGAPPAAAAAAPGGDDDAQFDELYEKVLWRLGAELRSDRERSGHLSDIW